MDQLPIIINFRIQDGVPVPDGLASKLRLETYLSSLEEGQKISCMYEIIDNDASHSQNNYFHKLCRVISEDTGQDMATVKLEAKIKAGLWESKTKLKSAADFSKTDMSAAIQGAIELGEELGINLYNY